jgi:hypothetical protein
LRVAKELVTQVLGSIEGGEFPLQLRVDLHRLVALAVPQVPVGEHQHRLGAVTQPGAGLRAAHVVDGTNHRGALLVATTAIGDLQGLLRVAGPADTETTAAGLADEPREQVVRAQHAVERRQQRRR